MSRILSLLAIFALTVSTATAVGTENGRVVLGSKTSFGQYGKGWGTRHPSLLDNDGDPSGRVTNIRWRDWGQGVALGEGDTSALPNWVPALAELRATRIARCSPNGPRAYTRLEIRVALRTGARFSSWQLWNGRPNVCHPTH